MKNPFYLILIFGLMINHSGHTQQDFYGFERSPVSIEKTGVEDVFFAYGSDWKIENGKRIFGRKVAFWNTEGTLLKSIDLSFLTEFHHNDAVYKGLLGNVYLSPDKKHLRVRGTQFQYRGDIIKTVIYNYDIENDTWSTFFYSKEYSLSHLAFSPENNSVFVAYNYDVMGEMTLGLFDSESQQMLQAIKSYDLPSLPIYNYISNDGNLLFVFDSFSNNTGNLEIFDTENYTLKKSLFLKDHITKIFESETEYFFSTSYGTHIYKKSDFSFVRKLSTDMIGLYPEIDSALLGPAGADTNPSPKVYTLSSNKIHYLSVGDQEYGFIYYPESKKLIGLSVKNDFGQKDQNEQMPTGKIYVIDIQ